LNTSYICVYDNPSTWRREAWCNGKVVSDISAQFLLTKDFKGGQWFDFRLNCGHWQEGVIQYGDKRAMEK